MAEDAGIGPLGFEPGRPRPRSSDEAPTADVEPTLEATPLVQPEIELVDVEAVESLLQLPFLLLNLTLGHGGPPDAFLPSDPELRSMARPATRIVNRHVQLQAVARHGDVISFGTQVTTFVMRESRRVRAYRVGDVDETPAPDSDLTGLFVRTTEPVPEDLPPWDPRHQSPST